MLDAGGDIMIDIKTRTTYVITKGDEYYCGKFDFIADDLLLDHNDEYAPWTTEPRFAERAMMDRVVFAAKEKMSKYIDGLKVKKMTIMTAVFVEDAEENE